MMYFREELQKRRRGLVNSQPTQENTAAPKDLPDVSNFSIEQSLEYQKTHNLSLEVFITNFANKIK